jgi:dTDP-glucose 4,6-dehydratase
MTKRLIITGGAGFIGANLVHFLLEHDPEAELIVVDKLTYAGNLRYLEGALEDARVRLVQEDIADKEAMGELFEQARPAGVYHLAAESHVDRSITGPEAFIQSNIVGTFVLLECARATWGEGEGRFLHVSTDEVFGSLGPEGAFTEHTPYDPSSPYSASKAASDHLVRAYNRTYGLDAVLTNCSNNFGPYQYPEKLIPVIIKNIRDGKKLPVFGDGKNVRDWLYVEDHCRALHAVFERGVSGRSYNIGTENEWENIRLVELLCDLVDEELGREKKSRELITFVEDRLGHDRRYAIDAARIREELGWAPTRSFEEAIRETVSWYLGHLGPIWGV